MSNHSARSIAEESNREEVLSHHAQLNREISETQRFQ